MTSAGGWGLLVVGAQACLQSHGIYTQKLQKAPPN